MGILVSELFLGCTDAPQPTVRLNLENHPQLLFLHLHPHPCQHYLCGLYILSTLFFTDYLWALSYYPFDIYFPFLHYLSLLLQGTLYPFKLKH